MYKNLKKEIIKDVKIEKEKKEKDKKEKEKDEREKTISPELTEREEPASP